MLRWFLLFATFSVIFGAPVFLWWRIENEKRRERVVRNLTSKVNPEGTVRTTVLIERPNSGGGLASFFKARPSPVAAERLSKGRFILLTLLAAGLGYLAGTKLIGTLGVLAPVIGAVAGAALPRMYRAKHRDKRLAAIEEQFPDALDFLARSVRAGNAFSIALELLGADAAEPLKSEVQKLTREMALGAGLEDALHGLVSRIPLLEVRLFVAAVLLQRETGGNLSEVLSKLATAVRERLRLRGQVKAASGQGRLTARVLTFLPIAVIVILKLASPAYINNLTNEPVGRDLLGAAAIMQILGYFVMQKIINFEV